MTSDELNMIEHKIRNIILKQMYYCNRCHKKGISDYSRGQLRATWEDLEEWLGELKNETD